MVSVTEIKATLAREGLATCTVDENAVDAFLRRFGEIVEKTEVRQHEGVNTYLAGRDAVPLHTDHPEADFVAWRCETQDSQDGASVLADGHAIIQAMGMNATSLRNVELHVPPQLPRQTLNRASVWNGERLYYAPWYPVVNTDNEGRRALGIFTSLLAMGYGHRRIRLQAGEMLLVDNGRWLHGRHKLPENSDRFLKRYWMRCQH